MADDEGAGECREVSALLPWLLNGTLASVEEQLVRGHLGRCQGCQRELEETSLAKAVFQRHVPASLLVSYAFDRPLVVEEREAVRHHLDGCQTCVADLALVRASQRLQEDEVPEGGAPVAPLPPRLRSFSPRPALAAAVVVACAGLAGGAWSWRQATTAERLLARERQELGARVAGLETENESLRRARSEPPRTPAPPAAPGTERAPQRAEPELNVPVLDLYPSDVGERGGRRRVNELQVSKDARSVVLILNATGEATAGSRTVRWWDAKERIVWIGRGLVPAADGSCTLSVPAELLREGLYTIETAPEAGRASSGRRYLIAVRRSSR